MRLTEQVPEIIKLSDFEQNVCLRHVDQMRHTEQQLDLLTDTGINVRQDLRFRLHTVMDSYVAERTCIQPVATDFFTQYKRVGVIPLVDGAAAGFIIRLNQLTVDVDRATIDRIEVGDDVL